MLPKGGFGTIGPVIVPRPEEEDSRSLVTRAVDTAGPGSTAALCHHLTSKGIGNTG